MSAPGHEGDTHHHHISEGLHDLKVGIIQKKYAGLLGERKTSLTMCADMLGENWPIWYEDLKGANEGQ